MPEPVTIHTEANDDRAAFVAYVGPAFKVRRARRATPAGGWLWSSSDDSTHSDQDDAVEAAQAWVNTAPEARS